MTSLSFDATEVVRHRLQPPRLPRVHLPRPMLVRRVLDVAPGGVCVLGAPAGYGCSVLLAEVARATGDRLAWVSVPREDRRGVWRHVVAGLAKAGVDVAEPARLLDAADAAVFRAALLNALAAVGEPVLLVLDDVDGVVHAGLLDEMTAVADSLPPAARLVLRLENGVLALRRLATTGQVVHLGVDDLALDDVQAQALLGRLDPALPSDRRDAVAALADGWVAALCAPFAPGARARDQDPAAWLLDVGVERVAAAVVDQLPADLRDLVVSASVVDVVTPALVARLAGCDEATAAASLDRLRRWGVLRASVERPGGSTLHRLVREYAQRQASLRGPDDVARLHRSAAQWLVEAGDTTAAIDQAFDTGDMAWALSLMEGAVGPLLDSGRADQVHRLYQRTPDAVLAERHLHLLAAAWAELMSGNLRAAHRRIDQLVDAVDALRPGDVASALALAADENDYASWLRGEVLLLRSYFAFWRGRPEQSGRLACEAQTIFGSRWTRTAHQATALHVVRPLVWFADPAVAARELLGLATRPGLREPYRRIALPGLQALLAVRQGQVRRARAVAEGAVWAARTHGSPAPFTSADARLALAWAHLDLGEAPEALSVAAGLADQAAEFGHLTYLCLARVAQARAVGRLGRRNEALDLLTRARHDLSPDAPAGELARHVDEAEQRLRLEAGDRAGAALLLRRLEPGPTTDLLAARLAPRGSDEMMRRLRSFRPQTVRQSVDAQLLLAAAYAAARPAEADACLLRAASTASQSGLLTALAGCPDEVQVIAARLATQPDGECVRVLLRQAAVPDVVGPAAPAPAARLSAGERHLLAAMEQTAGQRALAEALGVSVNTVKTRLRRLYQKLGVSDREAALAVARAAGLLTPGG